MNPPPLPYAEFPIAIRLVGRPTLEALWSGVFWAGAYAAAPIAFASGMIVMAILGIAILNLQAKGRNGS